MIEENKKSVGLIKARVMWVRQKKGLSQKVINLDKISCGRWDCYHQSSIYLNSCPKYHIMYHKVSFCNSISWTH